MRCPPVPTKAQQEYELSGSAVASAGECRNKPNSDRLTTHSDSGRWRLILPNAGLFSLHKTGAPVEKQWMSHTSENVLHEDLRSNCWRWRHRLRAFRLA